MAEPSKRPAHLKKPAHWDNPPVPKPEKAIEGPPGDGSHDGLEPTRYGDWERKGIAIDF
ncbi:MAG: hypothetical protein JWO65_1653 [Sphingomonas bacterium]|jgi:hypothetical protein|nr:hypothetical protein [Sphingomonas bacterium]